MWRTLLEIFSTKSIHSASKSSHLCSEGSSLIFIETILLLISVNPILGRLLLLLAILCGVGGLFVVLDVIVGRKKEVGEARCWGLNRHGECAHPKLRIKAHTDSIVQLNLC
jgi:hypothetical protein